MPSAVTVDRITNANIYMDGVSFLGRADEVEFALPKARMVDHKALGMFGTVEFPTGIDKLEAKIKWAAPYLEVLTGMSIFASHQFQVRASKESYTSQGRSAEIPVVCLMTAQFKEAGPMTFRHHEQVEFPSVLVVYHSEMYIAGVQVMLYDALANMYIVNGVDQLANYRANIGG